MIDKSALLLVVTAIFIAAVWLSAPRKAQRGLRSYWRQERLDAHRRYVNTEVMDDLGRAHPGYAEANQDAIRRLYRECGSY